MDILLYKRIIHEFVNNRRHCRRSSRKSVPYKCPVCLVNTENLGIGDHVTVNNSCRIRNDAGNCLDERSFFRKSVNGKSKNRQRQRDYKKRGNREEQYPIFFHVFARKSITTIFAD